MSKTRQFFCYPEEMRKTLRGKDSDYDKDNTKTARQIAHDFFELIDKERSQNRFDVIHRWYKDTKAKEYSGWTSGDLIEFIDQKEKKNAKKENLVTATLVEYVNERHPESVGHSIGYFLLKKVRLLPGT